jgi:DNA-binding MarR family transcriptional regulator
MKLEQEIRQQKFRNEFHKLAVNIAFTHFWVLDRMKARLKPFGISLQQFNLLRILRGQYPKPATINLLKERMMDKSSDASRLVERLRLKGFVERVTCSHDRRSVDIVITEKGLDVLKRVDAQDANMDRDFEALSESEAGLLNEMLDRIRSIGD